jgi:hypothetical protein
MTAPERIRKGLSELEQSRMTFRHCSPNPSHWRKTFTRLTTSSCWFRYLLLDDLQERLRDPFLATTESGYRWPCEGGRANKRALLFGTRTG